MNGWDKVRFTTPTSLNSIPIYIQIDWKLCEIFGTDFFFLLTPMTLNPGQGQLD